MWYSNQADLNSKTEYPGVAKFGIALEWGSRGLEFESRHSDQKRQTYFCTAVVFYLGCRELEASCFLIRGHRPRRAQRGAASSSNLDTRTKNDRRTSVRLSFFICGDKNSRPLAFQSAATGRDLPQKLSIFVLSSLTEALRFTIIKTRKTVSGLLCGFRNRNGEDIHMELKKQSSIHLLAGALYAVMALLLLIGLFSGFSFWSLLLMLTFAALGGLLFMERRDVLLPTAFCVYAVLTLITLFRAFTFANLLYLLGVAFAAVIMFAFLTDYLPNLRATVKSLWFAPAALLALRFIIVVIQAISIRIRYGFSILPFRGILYVLCEIAAILVACLWAVRLSPDEIPTRNAFQEDGAPFQDNTPTQNSAPVTRAVPAEGEGYYSLVLHVVLLLFTFGIWELIWVYRMTDYLNRVEGEEYRDPTKKLLLCIFVPFYFIYWTYKSAQRIDKYAQMNGVQSDIATLCLVLCFFVSILPPILMQDKVNAIVTARGGQTPSDPFDPQPNRGPAPNASSPRSDVSSIADDLARLQDLLNRGLITQEEYDAKRRQIIGL